MLALSASDASDATTRDPPDERPSSSARLGPYGPPGSRPQTRSRNHFARLSGKDCHNLVSGLLAPLRILCRLNSGNRQPCRPAAPELTATPAIRFPPCATRSTPPCSRSRQPPKRHRRSRRQAAGGTAEGSSTGLSILRLGALDLGHPGRCALGGTCLNPIWTDPGNGPAAAGSARYLQFLLADGIGDAATAQVTVTADQDSVRAAQDQQCSSSAAERCSRSATAASPNNEVANTCSSHGATLAGPVAPDGR